MKEASSKIAICTSDHRTFSLEWCRFPRLSLLVRAMAIRHIVIRLPLWVNENAGDLLRKMAYCIQGGGGEVEVMGRPASTYFTYFLLYTYIVVDDKRVKVSIGVSRGRMREGGTQPLCLRTRPKYMGPARAFVQTMLEEVIGETLQYHVDVVSNKVKWRMGDRNGCVSDVFEVVKTVDGDTLEEEQWHVFDFQNEGIGTLLRPGISM